MSHTCPLTLCTAPDMRTVGYDMARVAEKAVAAYNPTSIDDIAAWVMGNIGIIIATHDFPYLEESRRTYAKHRAKLDRKADRYLKSMRVSTPFRLVAPFDDRGLSMAGADYGADLGFTIALEDGGLGKLLHGSTINHRLDAVGLIVRVPRSMGYRHTDPLAVWMMPHPRHDNVRVKELLYL